MKNFRIKCAVFMLVVCAVLSAVGCGKSEASVFRSVIVNALTGDVTVSGENAFEGEMLAAGNKVHVGDASSLTLMADADKFFYVEANTEMSVDATGKEGSTKTVINIEKGSGLIRIDNKLGSDESFEVTTPNATMAIRGTVFRVSTGIENGQPVTNVKVLEGGVELSPVNGQGLVSDSKMIEAGQEANIISVNDTEIHFEVNDTISYDGVADSTKNVISELTENGRIDKSITGGLEDIGNVSGVAMGLEYLYIDTIVSNDPDNYIIEADILDYDETKFIEDAFSLSGRREQFVVSKDAVLKLLSSTQGFDEVTQTYNTYDINMQEFFAGGEIRDAYDLWHMSLEFRHLFGEAHIQDGKLVEFIQYYEE